MVVGGRSISVELLRRSSRNQAKLLAPTKIECDIEGTAPSDTDLKRDVTNHEKTIRVSSNIEQEKLDSNCDGYLLVDDQELDLERTLMGGQSFRWTKKDTLKQKSVFTGIVGQHVLKLWRCDSKKIAFKKVNLEGYQQNDLIIFLEEYFQLKYRVKDLYHQWSCRDENLKKCCEQYIGFRILRQDPVENLFSFICATCNNIKRISQMIDKMCKKFGSKLESKFDDSGKSTVSDIENIYYTFPEVERLVEDDVFQCLRYELGFGYRAKYIKETAEQLLKLTKAHNFHSPSEYLLSLRQLSYKETCKQLQQFPGIGRKVADCICLMSMDHLNAIPVDCHIYEIFCRNYMPKLRQERKSVTDAVHDLIGAYFTDLHGPLAGWSTSVLFVAELKHLKAPKSVDELLEKNWNKKCKNVRNGDDKITPSLISGKKKHKSKE